jgi:hypothetical protein
MKVGDLVQTTCFGPRYSRGEVGVVIKAYPAPSQLRGRYGRIIRCWVVLFADGTEVVAADGLEVINEA